MERLNLTILILGVLLLLSRLPAILNPRKYRGFIERAGTFPNAGLQLLGVLFVGVALWVLVLVFKGITPVQFTGVVVSLVTILWGGIWLSPKGIRAVLKKTVLERSDGTVRFLAGVVAAIAITLIVIAFTGGSAGG